MKRFSCAIIGLILEEKNEMGDRTFSSSDVLRIFDEHLDRDEQEVVRMFFREPSDINLEILSRILKLLLNLVSVITTPLIGLLVSVFPEIVQAAYNETVNELFRTNRSLSREIGRIDA